VKPGVALALVLGCAVAFVPMVGACGAAERAAAKDPMVCERDPKCAAKNGRARDCTTQCNDDPACMDRCREMSQDHLGAPP
jgi:hypothetical protein